VKVATPIALSFLTSENLTIPLQIPPRHCFTLYSWISGSDSPSCLTWRKLRTKSKTFPDKFELLLLYSETIALLLLPLYRHRLYISRLFLKNVKVPSLPNLSILLQARLPRGQYLMLQVKDLFQYHFSLFKVPLHAFIECNLIATYDKIKRRSLWT
jgi:hypothetical protein